MRLYKGAFFVVRGIIIKRTKKDFAYLREKQ